MYRKVTEIKEKVIKKVKENNLLKRIIQALIFGAGGAVISKGLLMLFNIVIARILTEQDYGAYSLINNTVQTFIVFAGAGIGVTLTRYVALYRDKNKEMAGIIIGTLLLINVIISLIVALIVFIFAGSIANILNSDIDITHLLRITAFTIFFTSVVSIIQGTLQGFEEYKINAYIQIIANLINFLIGVLITKLFGITGAVCALLILQIIMLAMMIRNLMKRLKKDSIRLKYNFLKEVKEALLKVTIPSFFASIFVIPLMWFTNFYFSSKIGLEEFAAFSVCMQWFNIINYIPQQFGQLKPIYTQLYDSNNFKEMSKCLHKVIIFSTAFAVICSIIFIFAKNIILGSYGEYYKQFGTSFTVMIIATIAFAIQSQYGSVFQAIGKSWLCFLLNTIWAIVYIIIFFFIYKKGVIGYAYTYLISYIVYSISSSIVFYYVIRKKKKNENSEGSNYKDFNIDN